MKRTFGPVFDDRASDDITSGIEEIFTDDNDRILKILDFYNVSLMQLGHYHTSLPIGSPQSNSVSRTSFPSHSLVRSSKVLCWKGLIKVIVLLDTLTSNTSFIVIPALSSVSLDNWIM